MTVGMSEVGNQLLAQKVVPGAGELCDLLLEPAREIRRRRWSRKTEMQAGGIALAKRQVIVDDRPTKPGREHLLYAHADFGREMFARHDDQDDYVAPYGVNFEAQANVGFTLDVEDQAQLRT